MSDRSDRIIDQCLLLRLTFRDMLTLPQSKPGRPHIKLEESEAVLTALLDTTCHGPREVRRQMFYERVEILKDLLEATDKYAMDYYQDQIKQAIITKWDRSLPVENMAYCAKWRDSVAICSIFRSRATWDENAYEGMKPWKLSTSTISAMGIDLYRMYVEAYHTACRSSATDVFSAYWVKLRPENPETCECNWDLCSIIFSRLAGRMGSGCLWA
jgi:hypothetical protein